MDFRRFPDHRTDSADDPWPILLLMHIIQSYANLVDADFVSTGKLGIVIKEVQE